MHVQDSYCENQPRNNLFYLHHNSILYLLFLYRYIDRLAIPKQLKTKLYFSFQIFLESIPLLIKLPCTNESILVNKMLEVIKYDINRTSHDSTPHEMECIVIYN